jgi:hypothetical protein
MESLVYEDSPLADYLEGKYCKPIDILAVALTGDFRRRRERPGMDSAEP